MNLDKPTLQPQSSFTSHSEEAFLSSLLAQQNMPRSMLAPQASSASSTPPVNTWIRQAEITSNLTHLNRAVGHINTYFSQSNFVPEGRVIDLGSGNGFFPHEVAQVAANKNITMDITAVDFLPQEVFQRNKETHYTENARNMVKYNETDLNNFSLDGQYNFINAEATLPYLPLETQSRIILEAAESLAPQGEAYLGIITEAQPHPTLPQSYHFPKKKLNLLKNKIKNIPNISLGEIIPENKKSLYLVIKNTALF